MSSSLKHTPLYDFHIKHGAKMVPFAGYEMPVQYSGIKDEHHAVRNAAGLFDVSHMGEAEFRGADACKAIDYLMTNDISKLHVGSALYTVMCNDDGGIVDDLIVSRLGPDYYLVCLNSANREKDIAHMKAHLIEGDFKFRDASDEWAQVALQGPKAETILSKMTDFDLAKLKRFQIRGGSIDIGDDDRIALIARTGYTGEDGFEIYIPASTATEVSEAILNAGVEEGLQLAGLGARDTLRLEAKYMLYGNDIDETRNPYQAGLSWVVKLEKDADFVGRDALKKLKPTKSNPLKEKMIGFRLEEKGILRSGYKIFCDGKEVGVLTSGGYSPTLETSIGLGYLATDLGSDAKLTVEIRGKQVPILATKEAFIKTI